MPFSDEHPFSLLFFLNRFSFLKILFSGVHNSLLVKRGGAGDAKEVGMIVVLNALVLEEGPGAKALDAVRLVTSCPILRVVRDLN